MSHIVKDDPVIESGEAARARHAPEVQHKRHLPAFWRHFLEMLAAMAVGMIVTGMADMDAARDTCT